MSDKFMYPAVGFYFKVTFSGISDTDDNKFKEVSGISVQTGTDKITEGGEVRYQLQLPTTVTYPNLVLKRGLLSKKAPLFKWCMETITSNYSKPIEPKTIKVMLYNEEGKPVKTWNFANARPLKWELGGLDSMKNEYAVETLEFVYDYFKAY